LPKKHCLFWVAAFVLRKYPIWGSYSPKSEPISKIYFKHERTESYLAELTQFCRRDTTVIKKLMLLRAALVVSAAKQSPAYKKVASDTPALTGGAREEQGRPRNDITLVI
jgi:hypothetical protein